MNIKALHLKALREPKFHIVPMVPLEPFPLHGVAIGRFQARSRAFNSRSNSNLSRVGPLTARMLKVRHIAELVGQEAVLHFGGWSMTGQVIDAQEEA